MIQGLFTVDYSHGVRPRFEKMSFKQGFYESYYFKAWSPQGDCGLWIRHTIHRCPNKAATTSVWFAFFDRQRSAPLTYKTTFTEDSIRLRAEDIQIKDNILGTDFVRGSAGDFSWDLTLSNKQPALYHLPGWGYQLSFPRTKWESPCPSASASGVIRLSNGETINIESWFAMVGHNWGAEHAERWVTLHGVGLGGDRASWFDLSVGRAKIGPWITPWVAYGLICYKGKRFPLGGIQRTLGTKIDSTPTSCKFSIEGSHLNVKGEIVGSQKDFIAWIYSDPTGKDHHTLNCSVAKMTLDLLNKQGGNQQTLIAGAATYETGVRDFSHGIPVQPFLDGRLA